MIDIIHLLVPRHHSRHPLIIFSLAYLHRRLPVPTSPSPQTDAQGNTPTTTIKVALTIEGTILFSAISSLAAFTDAMRQGLKKTLAIKCGVTADKVTLVITLAARRRRRHRGLAGVACQAGVTWSASGTTSRDGIDEGCNFCTNHAYAGKKCEFGVKTACTPTSNTVCRVEGGTTPTTTPTTTGGGGTRGVSVAYSVLADSQAAADKGEAALSTVASGGESAMLALLGELKANTPGGGFAGETQLKLFYDFLLLSGEPCQGVLCYIHLCIHMYLCGGRR